MLPLVLMRERTSPQPTSIRVRLMTEYMVEQRNFEIGVVLTHRVEDLKEEIC